MSNEENQIIQLNKVLREKNEDIENKEKLIASLRTQIASLQNYMTQNESFRKQTISIEERLNNSEMENSSFLSEKLKEVSDSENKLRASLILKDKILYDYNKTIKDHENTICMIKRQLIEKETSLNSLKYENNEINNKWKSMSFLFKQKEEELENYKDNYEKKIDDLLKEKEILIAKLDENKINIQNLTKVNSELDYKLRVLENDLNTEKTINSNNKILIDELTHTINYNKEELLEFREMKKNYISNEKYTQNIEADLVTEQTKNRQLNEDLIEISDKYKELKVKYSGENTIENLQSSKDILENENNNLRNTVESLNQLNLSFSISLKSMKQEITDITENINSELKNISQWVETYLGSYFNDDLEIASLPITINKTLKETSKLDELKQILFTTRKKINEEYLKLDKSNNLLKYELEESMKNQEKLIKDIEELKSLNNNDELKKELSSKLKRYEGIIIKIQNFYHQINKSDTLITREKSTVDELENDVLKLLGIMESHMNNESSAENKKMKIDYDKLKEEILKENNESGDIMSSRKKDEEISKLKEEINNLKKELNNKENILRFSNGFDKGDKLNDLAMLEKRVANLLREIELKDIQIISQEQMINRRNRELEEYRNKSITNNPNTDNSLIFKQKIKNLELEKENLTKDNLNLTLENKDMKEQINQLITEIPDINNEKYENLLKEVQHNLNLCEEEIKNKDILIRQLLAENRYLKQSNRLNLLEETQKIDKSEAKELSQEVKGLRTKIMKLNK